MFRPGDIIRIKNAEGPWHHLVGKVGIFICKDDSESLSYIVRPLSCAFKLKFAEEDLEYLCHSEDVDKIIGEENIKWM